MTGIRGAGLLVRTTRSRCFPVVVECLALQQVEVTPAEPMRFIADVLQELERRIAAARETVRRFQALPIVGPLLTDDDLYDEHGLPK